MNTRIEIATLIAEKIYTNNALKIKATEVKQILDEIIDSYLHKQDEIIHNDLSGLNDGDFLHLTASQLEALVYLINHSEDPIYHNSLSGLNDGEDFLHLNAEQVMSLDNVIAQVYQIINYKTNYTSVRADGTIIYYDDISAILNECTAGMTVSVNRSTSEAGNIVLRNGVNINLNGHTITLITDSSDGFIDGGEPVECTVFNGTVIKGGATNYALKLTNAGSNVCFPVKTKTTDSYAYGIYSDGKVSYANFSGSGGLYGDKATSLFEFCQVDSSGGTTGDPFKGNGLSLQNGATANFCSVRQSSNNRKAAFAKSNSIIKNCDFYCTGYDAVRVDTNSEIRNSTIKTLVGIGLVLAGPCKAYNCYVESLGGKAAMFGAGASIGPNEVVGCYFKSWVNLSADSIMSNSKFIDTTFIAVASRNTLFLGYADFIECRFINQWNNSLGHAVTMEQQGQYFFPAGSRFNKCLFSVANTSAYGIASVTVPFGYTSDTTPNISVSQCALQGSVNYLTGIENIQINTPDVYGNIILN